MSVISEHAPDFDEKRIPLTNCPQGNAQKGGESGLLRRDLLAMTTGAHRAPVIIASETKQSKENTDSYLGVGLLNNKI